MHSAGWIVLLIVVVSAAAEFAAELDGVATPDFRHAGSDGVNVVAGDDGAAGAVGAEHIVVGGNHWLGDHPENHLLIERGGPPQVSPNGTRPERRPINAEG